MIICHTPLATDPEPDAAYVHRQHLPGETDCYQALKCSDKEAQGQTLPYKERVCPVTLEMTDSSYSLRAS